MKTKLFLMLVFVLGMNTAIGQGTVTNVIATHDTIPFQRNGNIIIGALVSHDGVTATTCFYDASTGNQIGTPRIFPRRVPENGSQINRESIIFNDLNDFIVGGGTDDSATPPYNAIIHYYNMDSIQVTVRDIGFIPKKINGNNIIYTTVGPNADFLSSGYGSVLNAGAGIYIMKVNDDLTPVWATQISSDYNLVMKDMKATSDGKIAVSTGNGAWKIDPNTGAIINTLITGLDNHYNSYTDKVECINHSDPHITVKKWDGTVSAETDFQDYNIYDWDIEKIKSYEDYDLIITGIGVGKPVILKRSLNIENQDVIHASSVHVPTMPTGFHNMKILEITENSFTAVVEYNSNPGSFFGTPVPDATNTNGYYVVYTFNFTIDTNQYIALNDVSNITNGNIVYGINNAVLDGTNLVTESGLPVAYVVMNGNLPNVGDVIPRSWNLDSGHGGITFVYQSPVQENVNGRYIDVLYLDPNGDSPNPAHKEYHSLRIYFKTSSQVTLSTEEFSVKNFVLYPNPTTNTLHISAPKSSIKQVKIYNSLGQEIFSKSYSNTTDIRINTAHYPAATYFVSIQDKNCNTNRLKFIKK